MQFKAYGQAIIKTHLKITKVVDGDGIFVMNIFNPDFTDFINCLNQNNVEYILVGGYAVILRGYSRSTGDLDIWVNKTNENFIRLQKALKAFGLHLKG